MGWYIQTAKCSLHSYQKESCRIQEPRSYNGEPNLVAENPDAEVYLHADLRSALEDVEGEYEECASEGWRPYNVDRRCCEQ